jgi:hypothetical protein
MDRAAFEQLVSEWLDQPERDDLRTKVTAAAAQSSELERLKNEWVRLDQLVRNTPAGVDSIDWTAFQERIGQRLDADDARLDERLRKLTSPEQHVHWTRLRERIIQAVDHAAEPPPLIQFPLRRTATALALIGAAAALVLMVTLLPTAQRAEMGFAQVRVKTPAGAVRPESWQAGYARVTVSAPPTVEPNDEEVQPAGSGAARPQLGEVFLMVEPIRMSARTRAGPNPFGLD